MFKYSSLLIIIVSVPKTLKDCVQPFYGPVVTIYTTFYNTDKSAFYPQSAFASFVEFPQQTANIP
jgi:hypothetical protein